MLRLKNLTNKYQKRTFRVLYGHTQATPYAAELHSTLRDADGSVRVPLAADTTGDGYPLNRSADAYTLKNGLVPGTVMVKAEGETVAVATGADSADVKPFGFLANFVGGDLDDLGDVTDSVGVWYGKDAVFEVLAPAFDDTGLAAAYSAATAGNPVRLYAGTDGRLAYFGTPANRVAVAEVIDRPSASRILIKSLV